MAISWDVIDVSEVLERMDGDKELLPEWGIETKKMLPLSTYRLYRSQLL